MAEKLSSNEWNRRRQGSGGELCRSYGVAIFDPDQFALRKNVLMATMAVVPSPHRRSAGFLGWLDLVC
jgi:hypothetical protein